MSAPTKKFLIDTGIGALVAVLIWLAEGLFSAETAKDVFRILSDGFFVAGFLFLGLAGLTWAKNGGAMDGLGFTLKTAIARMRADYDDARVTFAQYREEREKKASSPRSAVYAGLVHMALAIIMMLLYSHFAG